MLYITALNTSICSQSSKPRSYAGPCAFDQYGRPIAGGINLCPKFFSSTPPWKQDVQQILHETTHISVFVSGLYNQFRNTTTGDLIPRDDVFDNSVSPPILKSPILLQTARDHFGCPTMNGVPLDPSSIAHWNMRYIFSETMNPLIITQQYFYSKFTLALMVSYRYIHF